MATKLNLFLQKKIREKRAEERQQQQQQQEQRTWAARQPGNFVSYWIFIRACARVCVCECAKFMLLFALR